MYIHIEKLFRFAKQFLFSYIKRIFIVDFEKIKLDYK